MLPVATAPNAIVFGASSMSTFDMMRAGIGMNVITLASTSLAINSYATPLFGLDVFPQWAVDQLPANQTCAAFLPLNDSVVVEATTAIIA